MENFGSNEQPEVIVENVVKCVNVAAAAGGGGQESDQHLLAVSS